MADLGFDLRNVDETQTMNFEPVPNGIYTVQVTGSENKQNKAGTGSFIKIEFTVVEKNYNGRKFWHNFNLFNPSEKAQNIGRAEIKRCILACGLSDSIRDSAAMHGKMLRVKIAIADQGGEYGLQNVIKDFYPIDNKYSTQATQVPKQPNVTPQYTQTPQIAPVEPVAQVDPVTPIDYANVQRPSWMDPVR